MSSGQVNWTTPLDARSERVVRKAVSDGDDREAAFAALYSLLLNLSDEPCSATGTSTGPLDIDIDGSFAVANDAEMLRDVIKINSGVRDHFSGTHNDNEPIRSYFEPQYAGSSMDRQMSHGKVGQSKVAPSPAADRQSEVPDVLINKNVTTVESLVSSGSSTMPSNAEVFDKSRLSAWMDAHALARSTHHCAMYCRLGMEAAGLKTGDRPQSGDAGDYGPFLLRHGARTMPQTSYMPQVGDVVVFDKTDSHPHGHIEMYDGQHWVSDFMQHSFSPYRDASSSPPFTIYRLS